MNGHYAPGDVVLGNWELVRQIGEGSYGKVFEARREDFGVTYRAAIKIITIPQSASEVKSARSEGMDDESVTAYFRGFVEEIVQEFVLMSKLKGNSNVVSYEDHTVIPHEAGIGWDIIIRMELLTPLLDYIQQKKLDGRDVVQLGIHLCRALELCQRFHIVHRDIKPENIFVSPLGDYKLGDFGIARTVEKTTGGLSKKGTYTYMAPEVYREEPYSASVDLYSLGLVMYRLLNDNRAPFLPAYPDPITHSDRERALAMRMAGSPLPPPRYAQGRLAEIILKACAFQPGERYASPTQMARELEEVLGGMGPAAPQNIPGEEEEKTTGLFSGPPPRETERTESLFQDGPPEPKEFQNAAPAGPQKKSPKQEKPPKQEKAAKGGGGRLALILAGCAAAVIVLVLFVLKPGSGSDYYYEPPTQQNSSGTPGGSAFVPDIMSAGGSAYVEDSSADASKAEGETGDIFPHALYLYGAYSVGAGTDVETYQADLSEFMEDMDWVGMVDDYLPYVGDEPAWTSGQQLSAVPFCIFQQSPGRSAVELEERRQSFLERHSEADWENFVDYQGYPRLRVLFCTPEGAVVTTNCVYQFYDGQLGLFPYTLDVDTYEMTMQDPFIFKLTFEGENLVIQYQYTGVSVPLNAADPQEGMATVVNGEALRL